MFLLVNMFLNQSDIFCLLGKDIKNNFRKTVSSPIFYNIFVAVYTQKNKMF